MAKKKELRISKDSYYKSENHSVWEQIRQIIFLASQNEQSDLKKVRPHAVDFLNAIKKEYDIFMLHENLIAQEWSIARFTDDLAVIYEQFEKGIFMPPLDYDNPNQLDFSNFDKETLKHYAHFRANELIRYLYSAYRPYLKLDPNQNPVEDLLISKDGVKKARNYKGCKEAAIAALGRMLDISRNTIINYKNKHEKFLSFTNGLPFVRPTREKYENILKEKLQYVSSQELIGPLKPISYVSSYKKS